MPQPPCVPYTWTHTSRATKLCTSFSPHPSHHYMDCNCNHTTIPNSCIHDQDTNSKLSSQTTGSNSRADDLTCIINTPQSNHIYLKLNDNHITNSRLSGNNLTYTPMPPCTSLTTQFAKATTPQPPTCIPVATCQQQTNPKGHLNQTNNHK